MLLFHFKDTLIKYHLASVFALNIGDFAGEGARATLDQRVKPHVLHAKYIGPSPSATLRVRMTAGNLFRELTGRDATSETEGQAAADGARGLH